MAWDTSLQSHVPGNALSRVYALDNLGAFVAVPVGQATVGPLAAGAGASRVEVLGGILFAIMALLPLTSSSVRRLPASPLTLASQATRHRTQQHTVITLSAHRR